MPFPVEVNLYPFAAAVQVRVPVVQVLAVHLPQVIKPLILAEEYAQPVG